MKQPDVVNVATRVPQWILRILEEHGREFEPALLPADIERGPVGKCFDWSALQCARHHTTYRYVEGIAKVKESGIWVLHAWLTDLAGQKAYDPTWRAVDTETGQEMIYPGRYIGIPMSILRVRDFMGTTGYQGIFGNWWRDPQMAEACLPKGKVLI